MKTKRAKKGKLPEIEDRNRDRGSLKVDIFNPEDFLGTNAKVALLSVEILKGIYDLTKSYENAESLDDPLGLRTETLKVPATATLAKKKKKRQATVSKAEAPLTSLITKDFDEEQIWEELELQNGFMYENLVTSTSKLLAYKGKPMEQDDSDVPSEDDRDDEEDVEIFSDDPLGEEEGEEEDEDSDFFESDEKYRKKALKQKEGGRQYPKSVVDDKFFSLAQMTEHIEQVEAELENAERKRPAPQDDEDEEESSDDDSIDLFEDVPGEDDEGEEKEKEKSTYFYKDFFDPPPNEDEERESETKNQNADDADDHDHDHDEKEDESLADEDEQEVLKSMKSVKFNLEPEEVESGNDDDDDKYDAENDVKTKDVLALLEEDGDDGDLRGRINQTLSTFQKRKKKIEENIEEIEQEALQPKSWQLMGEAKADTRPENALLEEHLIYDHLIRPAPEITVETTTKLEDVIKQRIKDGAWDDVQRKVRPVEDPREYKKRLVMDAEKSKASLADIYEKEYLEKKQTEEGEAEEKEPEEHIQIRKEMKKLFQKLDTLSHFHFTPKAPTAEVKIVVNTPSISIEETAGVSLSAANMLAPQEIEDNVKGAIKGKGERTSTDKKRERRKKKKKQHLKRLKEEDKARVKGLGLRNIKLAEGIIKQSAKNKLSAQDGYSTSQQSSKELKSSKAFFAKLQESATSHINKLSKRKNMASDLNNSNRLSAKKFKL